MGKRTVSVAFSLLLAGCTTVVSSVTTPLADDMASAILNSDDSRTVGEAMPAFLVFIDGLITGSPDDAELLRTGALLYSSYGGSFVTEPERREMLTEKALGYAIRGFCGERRQCRPRSMPYDAFAALPQLKKHGSVPSIYSLGTTWLTYIQAHDSDVGAMAELPRVRLLLDASLALNEAYEHGQVHMYLGGLETILPPALGGKPELGRKHFERAIVLSGGRNLMAKVVFAERYARLVFNKELHDRLLREVLDATPSAPDLTLINRLAQERAAVLLAGSDDYF